MSTFQPGQGKPEGSGRKKGTSNKKTLHLTDVLDSIGLNIPERIAELLPTLSAEDQVSTLISLMPYVYPKRKAIEQINLNVDASNLSLGSLGKEQLQELHNSTTEQLYGARTPGEREAEIRRLISLRENRTSGNRIVRKPA